MTTCTKTEQRISIAQSLPNCESAVIDPATRLLTLLKLWINRSKQRKQLATLDERFLKDVGISKVDANQEIAKPFWR